MGDELCSKLPKPELGSASSIIFSNIRGLFNMSDLTKPSILLDFADIKNANIINLVETHLFEKVVNSELTNDNWSIYRTDRKNRIGGGIAIYVRNIFSVTSVLSYSTSSCEITGVYIPEVNLANITVYRPPDSSIENFKDILTNMHSWLCELEQNLGSQPNIEITGDFNFPDMKRWDQNEIDNILNQIHRIEDTVKSLGRVKTQIKYLCDFIQDWFL